jgi:hypothetical protein
MNKPESIIEFFGQMLSKREYFIPLIAAQYQFPNHYYGLTSAALLEDLFVDAAINFKNQEHHGLQFERTDAKGEKGWDYRYDGQNYSHKVGGKVQSIALLWDATYQLPEDSTYSYPSPIVMVLSNYNNKNATLTLNSGEAFQITPLSQFRSKAFTQGQQILIVRRTLENNWKLLEVLNLNDKGSELNETLKLQVVWQKMLEHWANDQAANSIEIFVTKSSKKTEIPVDLTSRDVTINFKALPGVYLFPKESLQKVKVAKNNRAILLPTEKVQELMDISCEKGNFTYLPNWFTYFATNRSVDLYLVQRAEYDRLNSAARD